MFSAAVWLLSYWISCVSVACSLNLPLPLDIITSHVIKQETLITQDRFASSKYLETLKFLGILKRLSSHLLAFFLKESNAPISRLASLREGFLLPLPPSFSCQAWPQEGTLCPCFSNTSPNRLFKNLSLKKNNNLLGPSSSCTLSFSTLNATARQL